MDSQHETEVLIVGAGPTGLVLACDLARRGVAFRLVDKAAEHFGGSRADGLQPRTLEVFADLGVLDELFAAGDGGLPMRSYRDGELVWEGRPAEPSPATPAVPYPDGWFVPQFRTEEILRKSLAGIGGQAEPGTELRGFTQHADHVTARLGDGTSLRARYLVGADGGHSTVRRELGIGFPGKTDESTRALFADVRLAGLDRSHALSWSRGAESVMAQPLAGTGLFTIAVAGGEVEATPEHLREVLTRVAGIKIRVLEVHWNTSWRANSRLADRYRDGRVLLAGDAAHVCPPTGGQGMNTGVQDAYNLGWKLAAVLRGADPALLDGYERERRPVARHALELSERLLGLYRDGDAEAHVRGPELHQLTVNYRGGPLAVDTRPEPAPVRAGDRAPDAPCLRDGSPVRLFELLRGPHWTLLDFGGAFRGCPGIAGLAVHSVVREAAEAVDVVDVHGHAHDAYGITAPTLLLIRPDGYIGWCAQPGDLTGLHEYLQPKLPTTTTTGPEAGAA